MAVVVANYISEPVAEQAGAFLRKHAPDTAVGLMDSEGFRSFSGFDLEFLDSERRAGSSVASRKLRAHVPQLFSDLNQWMLKVLLAPGIPESYLSAPRSHYEGASQLAAAAGASVMSAFRFVEQFTVLDGCDPQSTIDSSVGRLQNENAEGTSSELSSCCRTLRYIRRSTPQVREGGVRRTPSPLKMRGSVERRPDKNRRFGAGFETAVPSRESN